MKSSPAEIASLVARANGARWTGLSYEFVLLHLPALVAILGGSYLSTIAEMRAYGVAGMVAGAAWYLWQRSRLERGRRSLTAADIEIKRFPTLLRVCSGDESRARDVLLEVLRNTH